MKYVFIRENDTQFPTTVMCRVLQVRPSSYYAWSSRGVSDHRRRDEELSEKIQLSFQASRGRYGSPRVHRELRREGMVCSEKRVARLMREEGLAARKARRFTSTTDSRHPHPVAKNVLNRNYQVQTIADVNRVWAGDITYIPTAQGWLYLAVVLDLKSRKVIGWSMADTLEQPLVGQALQMALSQRLPGKAQRQLLFHSDRGSQYAAHETQQLLQEWEVVPSMSRKGNCWDNAPLESFFATLKKELVHRENYQNHEQAKASLFQYIEVFYNRRRAHSALGFLSPNDYEQSVLI